MSSSDETNPFAQVPESEIDPAHPPARYFRRKDQTLIRWHENKIGGTDHPWWFYNVGDISKWFTASCVSVLQPGEQNGLHSHMEEVEGPYESWYIVLKGRAMLRTEYYDAELEEFDAAFMPPGASHQFRCLGTEPMWFLTLSSRGGQPMKVDTYTLECSEDRPGYLEEYNRIVAARKARGLTP